MEEEPSKFDLWLEKKLGNEGFQKAIVGIAVFMGLGLSILLFFLLPMIIGGFFDRWFTSNVAVNLVEGIIRMVIFMAYMLLVSRMEEMKRVFSYHGAEHKTIRCYEAGLPLTVENVRKQSRFHPRCGTSFIFLVLIISIFVGCFNPFDVTWQRVAFSTLLLPLVMGISYELIRIAGRSDNTFTRILSAPGLWVQRITTKEPDDEQIQCAITAITPCIPESLEDDAW